MAKSKKLVGFSSRVTRMATKVWDAAAVKVGFDPMTIMAIITAIIDAIKACREERTNDLVKTAKKMPQWVKTKMFMAGRRELRQAYREAKLKVSRRQINEEAGRLVDSACTEIKKNAPDIKAAIVELRDRKKRPRLTR